MLILGEIYIVLKYSKTVTAEVFVEVFFHKGFEICWYKSVELNSLTSLLFTPAEGLPHSLY